MLRNYVSKKLIQNHLDFQNVDWISAPRKLHQILALHLEEVNLTLKTLIITKKSMLKCFLFPEKLFDCFRPFIYFLLLMSRICLFLRRFSWFSQVMYKLGGKNLQKGPNCLLKGQIYSKKFEYFVIFIGLFKMYQ